MTRLFIVGEGKPFAQNTKIEDLQPWQIGVYGMNRDTYKLEPFHIDAVYDFLTVYSGSSNNASPTFDVGTNKESRFTKVPYKAPVYNVWRWSVTKDVVAPNDVFELIIGTKDNLSSSYPRSEFFSVRAGKKTLKELYAEAAKEVCKSRYFEATADDLGVIITTKFNYHWPIEVGGKFVKSVDKCYVCNTAEVEGNELVGWAQGSGDPASLRWLDEKLLPERGALGDPWSKLDPQPALFNDDGTFNDRKFDIYTLESGNFISNNGDNGREGFEQRHKLIVAFDTANVTAQQLYVKAIETGLNLKLRTRLATSPFI